MLVRQHVVHIYDGVPCGFLVSSKAAHNPSVHITMRRSYSFAIVTLLGTALAMPFPNGENMWSLLYDGL
jgi:hypothetical protein